MMRDLVPAVAAGVLPALAWAAMFAAFARHSPLARAFVTASVIWGTFAVIVTEALSATESLGHVQLALAWAMVAGGFAIRARRVTGGRSWLERRRQPSAPEWSGGWMWVGAGLVVLLVGVTAWLAPPNTWDSLVYHMARVEHWIQNRGVGHYPTHITRQLYTAPWAEYAILQFQLLTGTDRVANAVSFFSMVGCVVLVAAIVRDLGGSRDTQSFAGVFVATLPMGIMQASSTQNDYVLGFWLVCLLYLALPLLRGQKEQSIFRSAALSGCAVGLALLTKPTAYLFLPPFLLWIGYAAVRYRRRAGVLQLAFAAICAVAINLPFYARNVDTFGHAFGSREIRADLANATHGIGAVGSNLVRNAALHLTTPSTKVNARVAAGIAATHRAVGLDADDDATTFGERFYLPRLLPLESTTGNPLHFILVGVAAVILARRRGGSEKRVAARLMCALALSTLIFCLYLKWQPFGSRFHLPLFVIAGVPVAMVIAQASAPRVTRLVAGSLLVTAVPWIIFNIQRPLATVAGVRSILLTTRAEQYFPLPWQRGLGAAIDSAAAAALEGGCRRIGLQLGDDDPEYALWRALARHTSNQTSLTHVNVANPSRQHPLSPGPATPCSVLSMSRGEGQSITYPGSTWAAAGIVVSLSRAAPRSASPGVRQIARTTSRVARQSGRTLP